MFFKRLREDIAFAYANDPAAREAMVKAAQCLREAGYDVKDPQAGEGISVKDIPEDVLNKCFQQSGAAK